MEKLNRILTKLVSAVEGVKDEREMLIRIVIAIVVFAVFLIFRNQISKAVSYIVGKIFFKRSEKTQKEIGKSLYKPLSYFIAVLGFFIGSEVIAPSGEIKNTALFILKLAAILLSAGFAINLINSDASFIIRDDSSKARKTAAKFINNVMKGATAVVAGLLVLEQFGISASRIFAALGIGGVAVAFACKDTVENMLSGFIIIFDKPFEVDDFIEVNGDSGTVKDITIRTTRLIGLDGCTKIYPNTTMANAAITNWSKIGKRLFNETIWINYSHTAKEIDEFCDGIKKLVLQNENVLPEDVRVNFISYGTHALEIEIFFYVKVVAAADFQSLKSEINTQIKNYADSTDVELAFESKSVYFANELSLKK